MKSLLHKLKNKPVPEKKQEVTVIVGNGDRDIKPLINDKRSENFDRDGFITKLKENMSMKIQNRLEEEKKQIEEEGVILPMPETDYVKPQKVQKKIKIMDESEVKEVVTTKDSKVKKLETPVVHVGDFIDQRRFKKVKNVDIRVSSYYMNNRESFINFITKIFSPYSRMIKESEGDISCNSKNTRELMIHQRIVRDYINLYTPYRGLLLYHGLGSGKTCSSIGIAEGMKNDKRIIIMTPASLKANYISQLKECGDYMYKLNQHWEWFVADSPEKIDELSRILSFPKEDIRKKGGAWLVNVTRQPNYSTLTIQQQELLNKQIDKMIANKYTIIGYNGLRTEKLREMTDNFKINLFDDAVVIVDEAHNLISRIVNKLNKSPEAETVSLILYKYLMSCQNSKIVLLTGTPMVNYPNEIGILFNILRGYIKTWQLSLDSSSRISHEILHKILEVNKQMDYFEFSSSTKTLTITRNPMGYDNVYDGEEYMGVKGSRNIVTDEIFIGKITQLLRRSDIEIKNVKTDLFKCLPDNLQDFQTMFIENGELKNENLLKRRIIGLTSYFRSAQEELMPKYIKREDFHIINIPMSDYQFEVYERARIQERKMEKNARKGNSETSTYRIFSRLFCNFVMPNEIGRPLPNEEDVLDNTLGNEDVKEEEEVDEGEVDEEEGEEEEVGEGGDEVVFVEGVEEHKSGGMYESDDGIIFDEGGSKAEAKRIKEEEKARKAEEKAEAKRIKDEAKAQEKVKKQKDKEDEKARKAEEKAEAKRIKDEAKAEEKARKQKEKEEKAEKLRAQVKAQVKVVRAETEPGGLKSIISKIEKNDDDEDVSIDDNFKKIGDLTYETRIREALRKLIANPEFLTEGLKIYSPKYLQILERIQDASNVGLHLVYSQFRTLEGIGIFAEVLKANGFAEFKLKNTGGWDIDIKEEDVGKPTFALYTGTEGDDEKELIRKIFNGEWNDNGFPPRISEKLNAMSSDNNMGEIIKVFMITASGSEGINLRNTRFVHIMEPYWHPARTEQVIGRARRICSHQTLPKELQTVEVFIYLMIFTEAQKKSSKELRKMDLSKRGNPREPLSSDYALYEINLIKTELADQITMAIKESSVDCAIHPKSENITCMNFGSNPSNDFISKPSILKESTDKVSKLNIKPKAWRARKISINGESYALNEDTQIIYDYDAYKRDELKRLGERVRVGDRYEIRWD